MKNIFFLLLIVNNLLLAQTIPTNQTLTGSVNITCPQNNNLVLQSSQMGFDYYLRNHADNVIIGSALAGTGNALNFQTGVLSQTTSFHVLAANPTNNALDFNGLDGTIEISHDVTLQPSNAITIEAWIYPTDINSNANYEIYRKENSGIGRILFAFQNNGTLLSFGLETETSAYVELDNPIVATDYTNQWVHVMATYDGVAMKVYRNGTEIGTLAKTGLIKIPTTPTSAYIGSSSSVAEFFKGKIASMRLWDKALNSRNEIQLAMNDYFDGTESGLIAYYDFNENSGVILNDRSNNNTGMLLNGVNWTTGPMGQVGKVVSKVLSIACSIYVDKNAVGNNDGSSWANAFTSIQAGVNAAMDKDSVLIAEGNYRESSQIVIGRQMTLKGGYSTGGTFYDNTVYKTVLDGSGAHRVMFYNNTINNPLFLSGLTIQNGVTTAAVTDIIARGGGIYTNADIIFLQTHVMNNLAINNSFFTTVNTFTFTFTYAYGGGVFAEPNTNITLINSVLSSNTANSDRNTHELNHTLSAFGGGIYGDQITLINSEIINNSARSSSSFSQTLDSNGGGVFGTNITLINSFVAYNRAFLDASRFGIPITVRGGGLFGTSNLKNSILWGNLAGNVAGNGVLVPNEQFGSLTASNSLIKAQNPAGNNNIDGTVLGFNPRFIIDDPFGDFHLRLNSALINSGDINFLPLDTFDLDNDGDYNEILPVDFDGQQRVSNALVDIGIYEVLLPELIFLDGFE